MYEVGSWFVWVINIAILIAVAFVVLLIIMRKRSTYAKEAIGKLQAEIQLASGWSEYHTIPIDENDKTVTIDDKMYHLNTEKRRFGRYPREPFLGLKWLQVPIRIETWAKDNPEPIRASYDQMIATSAEILSITREIQATNAAMEIQEIEARQSELVKAISNQPNKTYVYIGLGAIAAIQLIGIFVLYNQLANLMAIWGL